MLAKNLYCSAEITFWNMIIFFLSTLTWIKHRQDKIIKAAFTLVMWASTGFVLGLTLGYFAGL